MRGDEPRWRELSGVAAPVRVRARKDGRVVEERRGDLLVTHRGFSGPVILDTSRHVSGPEGDGVRFVVSWGGPGAGAWDDRLREPRKLTVAAAVRRPLPRRLADHLVRIAGADGRKPLDEVATETLESRFAARLYLCGEMLDVIGRVGGYNFLWAWVSGRRAGESAARAAAPGSSIR